ncbi:hypothetical protein [Hahella ganghwensis]|uniref:hypothetical protein n=1 Tax=Hahella ganghwensis TaxID=286420 RepID=UPI00036374E8|nr:hypothetical protein [Hahella ganghwensis]
MNLQRSILAAAVTFAALTSNAQTGGFGHTKQGQNQDSSDWLSDQALQTFAPFFGYFHRGKTIFPVFLENTSEETSQGPHRVLVYSHRKVFNAEKRYLNQ